MKPSLSASLPSLVLLAACAAPSSSGPAPEAGASAAATVAAPTRTDPASPVSSTAPRLTLWEVHGTWTDACCCKVPCPCLFGSGATEGHCEGASLFEIDQGHDQGVALDGVRAVVTYRVGQWTSICVDENASPEQVTAVGRLVPRLLGFVQKGAAPVVTTGPITVDRGEHEVRYSGGGSQVDLELVESASGEPIVLQNLPAKGTPFPPSHDHTQYRSRHLAHGSELGTFEHEGRNGFVSRLDVIGHFSGP